MNFDFNQKEQSILSDIDKLIKAFCKEIDINVKGISQREENLRKALSFLSQTPYLELGIKEFKDIGSMTTLISSMELLSQNSPSIFMGVESSVRIFGKIIDKWGTENQRKECLESVLNGTQIGAFALSEDSISVDNQALKTCGVKEGDEFVINGKKSFCVNAPIADWYAVAGKIQEKNAIFLIKKSTDGFSTSLIDTIGYNGSVISNISLDNCKIPASYVIEEKDMLNTIKLWENQVLIGAALGIMKSSYESAKLYAKTHKSGGKPIIAYQVVAFKLAEMLTLYQTSQLLAHRSFWLTETNDKEKETLTYCAKVFCTEASEKVASDSLSILSGYGLISGNHKENVYMNSKYGQITGTSTEIAKVKIGDFILK